MFCSSDGWCVVELVGVGLWTESGAGTTGPRGLWTLQGLLLNPEAKHVDVDESRAQWMERTKLSGCFWGCSSLGLAWKPEFFQSDGKGRKRRGREEKIFT